MAEDKQGAAVLQCYPLYSTLLNTSGFATTHVVVSVRHPITY